MKAMILAAGFGTRLKEITKDKPKPLVEVAKRRLIDYSLDLCTNAGVSQVVVNTHYKSDMIKSYLSKIDAPYDFVFSEESEILGTGGGVANCRSYLEKAPFYLVNSDVICDINLKDILKFHKNSGNDATMVVRKNPSPQSITPVYWDNNNILKGFGAEKLGENLGMFTGIQILEPLVFNYLKPKFSSIINDFYVEGRKDGVKIGCFEYSGKWFDMGTIESIKLFEGENL